jgi:hypothetical protein
MHCLVVRSNGDGSVVYEDVDSLLSLFVFNKTKNRCHSYPTISSAFDFPTVKTTRDDRLDVPDTKRH